MEKILRQRSIPMFAHESNDYLDVFDGIGFKLNEFFNLFDIASIFAYTLSFVAVMIFVEYAIVSPIERRLNKWRTV